MLKAFIRRKLYSLGWHVQRLGPQSNPSAQLLAALQHMQVDLVFDIGANVGQFAQDLRAVGFPGRIVSFEPLSAAHSSLVKAARRDPNWTVHSRVALGDQDGDIRINISGNSVSSSVLPMLDAHSSAAVSSSYVGVEKTPLARLDSVASDYLQDSSRAFIKIDTQGFEWQVLDGADHALKRAHGVLLELSLVPLYEGQRLWCDIIERMEREGFTLWTLQQGFTDLRSGRTLQVDAIFLREANAV